MADPPDPPDRHVLHVSPPGSVLPFPDKLRARRRLRKQVLPISDSQAVVALEGTPIEPLARHPITKQMRALLDGVEQGEIDPRGEAPTRALRRCVRALAGFGLSETDIAKLLGTNHNTLVHYYRTELDVGHLEAVCQVAETAHALACSGEFPAATFSWLKMRAGWRESITPLDAPTTNNRVIRVTGSDTRL